MLDNQSIVSYCLELLEPISAKKQFNSAIEQHHNLVQTVELTTIDMDDPIERIHFVLDFFYTQSIFGTPTSLNKPQDYDLVTALNTHTASSPVLAIILADLFTAARLEAHAIIARHKVLVRIELEDNQFVFIEASAGVSLEWDEVKQYLNIKDKKQNQIELPDEQTIGMLLLSMYKTALMDKALFAKALEVVDLIISFEPENPYERRDRGFVLQQLNCDSHAVADYKYFIEQCPADPLAPMIKMQLDDINNNICSIH
ncbi:tetratricopeptide repeat protein [Catenovulum sp. SX2]|uniref:tetratricopeptide repeat protein n=1 Tax=Catenovulum sp. SX2 TaxID=3398614 RepID=UPI003F826524